MLMPAPIITLLTDFGTTDVFIGVMKGVILGVNPEAKIVDLSHDIPSYDIQSAAYVLRQASPHFPKGTVHLVVVDPGVGGNRKPIAVQTSEGIFIGPDNGVFSYIYEAEPRATVFEISARKYRLKNTSPTFEGRDVFAPAAAWITKGISPSKLGDCIVDPAHFDIPKAKAGEKGKITGEVVYSDRFGNLITNITRDELKPVFSTGKGVIIWIGDGKINGLKQYYGEARPGELAALMNSDGQLEIFVRESSAKNKTAVKIGEKVKVGWAKNLERPVG